MRKLVKRFNNIFIAIILALFYFVIIGLALLLQNIVNLKKKKINKTYWLKPPKIEFSDKFFSSPY